MEIEVFVVSICMLIFLAKVITEWMRSVQAQIIDVTDVARPTVRESYWIDKLNCLAPLCLNVLNG